jgi:hypothetical protein
MKLQAISAAVVAVLANRGTLRAEQPVIQSVLNAASFTTAVAPGTWVTIFGNGLASDIAIGQTTPCPVQLNGVTVTVGGVAAPVSYVSPTQVNALIPYEAATVSATQRVTAPGNRDERLSCKCTFQYQFDQERSSYLYKKFRGNRRCHRVRFELPAGDQCR